MTARAILIFAALFACAVYSAVLAVCAALAIYLHQQPHERREALADQAGAVCERCLFALRLLPRDQFTL